LFFPASRGWAAALDANGDLDHFRSILPNIPSRSCLARSALARVQSRKADYEDAAARWEAGFFAGKHELTDLAGLERRRAAAANSLMVARLAFLPLHMRYGLPTVRFDVADPQAVSGRHGARLAALETAFAAPDPPRVFERSRMIPSPAATSWIRCPVSVGGEADTLWARVDEPAARPRSGTLVFTHGICLENEFWGGIGEPPAIIHELGLRTVMPEGPYHGRRRKTGSYGGEPVLARGPMGMLDYFAAHVVELGLLAAWARRNGGGPVAVGGVSLGALTAQLYASIAHTLPPAMRADAVFLVTTSASLMPVAMTGSLPRALGIPEALAARGWRAESLDRWRPLLDPQAPPAVTAARIIAVLGAKDDLTPYAEGLRLTREWRLPEDNVFTRKLGHFTTSLGLYRDEAPFRRLAEVMSTV
jgi:hypothetical protein